MANLKVKVNRSTTGTHASSPGELEIDSEMSRFVNFYPLSTTTTFQLHALVVAVVLLLPQYCRS